MIQTHSITQATARHTHLIQVPGDKSISHRVLMLASLCPNQSTIIHNLSPGEDVAATRRCLEALGVRFETLSATSWQLTAPERLTPTDTPLDCGNSGTTMRLLSGLLAGLNIPATLIGDTSLNRRPMRRIVEPLAQMGANIATTVDGTAPITIMTTSQALHGIQYEMPLASAQVKSCLLLAGLFADSPTSITESIASRDHTERLLKQMGVSLLQNDTTITLQPVTMPLALPAEMTIPGDFSAAAFWLTAGCLIPDCNITLPDVSLNPTRTGYLQALRSVGANIEIAVTGTTDNGAPLAEPVDTLIASTSHLKGGITISASELPTLIDEIPVLAVMGTYLEGTLTVNNAQELRHKESDRLQALADNFKALDIEMTLKLDGFMIQGNPHRLIPPPAKTLQTFGDHRIAMALYLLEQVNQSRQSEQSTPWQYDDLDCIAVSDPDYLAHWA